MNKVVQEILQGKKLTFKDAVIALQHDFPLLKKLKNTPQDPIWHAEGDVAIHTDMVMQEAQNLRPDPNEDKVVLVLGALFHDIGKPLCTREFKEGGLTRIGSNRHAQIGADYLTPIIARLGLHRDLSDRILNIVRYHHHPRKIYRSSTDQVLWEFSQILHYQEILLFEKADLLGRIYENTEQEVQILELVEKIIEEKVQEVDIRGVIEHEFSNKPKERRVVIFERVMKFLRDGICSHPFEAIGKAQSIPTSFSTVTILCGSARSGKTSYRNQNSEKIIISLDDLRIEITGKKDCFKKDGQVAQEAYKRFKLALAKHEDIIWDSTNTTVSLRRKILETAENYGAQTQIISFIIDPREVHRRNQKSEEQVPASVIDKFYRNWEIPTLNEAHRVECIY